MSETEHLEQKEGGVILEGFLTKLGGIMKNWKLRYCVLENSTLRYYKSKEDKQAAGEINLPSCQFMRPSTKFANSFELGLPQRTFIFTAENQHDCDLWIKEVGKKIHTKRIKQGYLIKEGNIRKSWKRRYCIVTSNCLKYYKKKDDVTPLHSIELQNNVVSMVTRTDVTAECCFSVTTPNRTFFFVATSPFKAQEWVSACQVK